MEKLEYLTSVWIIFYDSGKVSILKFFLKIILDDSLKVRILISISFASFLVGKFIISFSLVLIHLLV